MFYIIKVGTITNAQRARGALRNHGIRASVTRLKNPQPVDGCGYAVQVITDDINKAVNIVQRENIYIRGVERV